ncbi:hypothetical protein ABI59_07135 [Acidobacteria bacterium Mor1]|nr:hypothetical protein ABI59_07135 [Acidobacteria bacterium Mor1]
MRRYLVALAAALLLTGTATAQTVRQITDFKNDLAGPPVLDDAGAFVYCGASPDLLGQNGDHAYQIFRFNAADGSAEQLTDVEGGVSPVVSVSDDGVWLAFASPADLTGGNPDRSIEAFARRADGSETVQLTANDAVNAGNVSQVVLSGDAGKVLMLGRIDPLGTNAGLEPQLFLVDRDGSNLVQLTTITTGSFGAISISDDGTRIVFGHNADLTGGNADLGSEVFAIDPDGTNLRQLTNVPVDFGATAPVLSGNGVRIAFQTSANLTGGNGNNQTEIHVVDWDGTNLRQVTNTVAVFGFAGDPSSQLPSITDDGNKVFYFSNYNSIFINLDGNFEIFSENVDGSGLDQVTSNFLSAGSLLPIVSGNGNRVTYYSVGDSITLDVATGTGGSDQSLFPFVLQLTGDPALAPDGSRALFTQTPDPLFGSSALWKVEADGSGVSLVTATDLGSVSSPEFAGDAETIVFSANGDPLGLNPDTVSQIFRIQQDGTGLQQLTSGGADSSSSNPAISDDASRIVFDSNADLTGGNADLSREVFAMDADGMNLVQLTAGIVDTSSRRPRIDATGTWVVFESNADLDGGNPDGSFEVWRVQSNGTGLERLTSDPAAGSGGPDISDDATVISYQSSADPTGGNADGNSEIFAYRPATLSTLQLTSTSEGNSGGARLSGNGAWVWFSSDAPIAESDADTPTDLYRVPAAGGTIERVGALRAGVLGGVLPIDLGGGTAVSADAAGERALFSGIGDFTQANRDLLAELWLIDRADTPVFTVGKADPTVLSWTHGSGPIRYDVIRGDVANLAAGGDLGAVTCLEEDSPEASTEGFGDTLQPTPGQVLFFLYRGSEGLNAGPGSYGQASDGSTRTPASGGCVDN